MTDARDEIHETLTRLHGQLEAEETLDGELRTELRDAIQDIRRVLEDEDDSAESVHGLGERLSRVLHDLEDRHPALTSALGRVADALSSLGI